MGGPRIQTPRVEEIVQTRHLHGIHKVGGPFIFKPLHGLQSVGCHVLYHSRETS
jgi:hypothetical protein